MIAKIEPGASPKNRRVNQVEIRGQEGISVLEIPLVLNDDEVKEALELLKSKGVTLKDIQIAYEHQPVPRPLTFYSNQGAAD
ncbi:hypothetical protein YSY43_37820 [Paenibacillus sp. YSY-4.3]